MNITKVLGDRVLIEPLPVEQVSAGGIELPQSVRGKQSVGIVRMVGEGTGDPSMRALMAEIAIGQTVRTNINMGSVEVTFNNTKYQIHSVRDVEMIL